MDFSAHMTIRFPLQMHKLDFHAICKWILTFFSSFLHTGDSYHTLSNRFRVGVSTVHHCIRDTCDAIWQSLVDEEMPVPTKEHWIRIEHDFNQCWGFPNCIGSLDGKHIIIMSPANSGSLYHNYKGTFSINLMALVDANYRFIFVDIGDYGSNADGTVFSKSEFGQMYLEDELDVPGPKPLPNAPELGNVPHVIVADEAFPLKPNIMRPYQRARNGVRLSHEKQIYNYRLSQACRLVENAFGILAQHWCCFNRRLQLKTETVVKIVQATFVLHNYLRVPTDATITATYARLNPDRLNYLGPDGAIVDLQNLNGYRSAQEAQ